MAKLNSMDGIYFLLGTDDVPEEPPVPDGTGEVAVAPGCVGVTTFAQWADVDVTISDDDFPPELMRPEQYAAGWDAVVTGSIEATRPVWLVDMEFAPVGRRAVLSRPGRYEFLLLARRAESVVVRWPGPVAEGDEPTEQHTFMFRRTGD